LQQLFASQANPDDQSWLTGSFIDLILCKFAHKYPKVHFMGTEFAALQLRSAHKNLELKRGFVVNDILGKPVNYDCEWPKSIVFAVNIKNRHWNLLRVQHWPHRELQLFEPMGKPASRGQKNSTAGVSLRYIPHDVLVWLDKCWPCECNDRLGKKGVTWQNLSRSAITFQHQLTGFDCGVACLLYAEKCGQGLLRQDIEQSTDQAEITKFRKLLCSSLESIAA
jgi:hypothetical protein